jgi:uncharacterized repeat protein (TIGR01451 family)
MSTFRSSRLRVEVLEGRAVPAIITGTDSTVTDSTVASQTSTDTGTTTTTTTTGDTTTTTTTTNPTTATATTPAVDLGITTTVDHLKPSLGDTVTVKVKITNSGSTQSTGATANVTLPAGLSFVSSNGGNAFDPTTGTWTPGTIAANGTATLTVKATVTDPSAQPVTATINQADQPDSNTQNNTANLNITPVLAKLNLMTSMSAASVGAGSTVVMTVAVGNGGAGKARGVSVPNTLGPGLTLITPLTVTQGSYNAATKSWTVGTVAPGTIAVLRLLVEVAKIGQISSPVALTGTGYDTTTSKVNSTAVVTGVKPSGIPSWSYFGPGFSTGTTPVPAVAAGSSLGIGGMPVASQFLLTHGFSLNGQTLQ